MCSATSIMWNCVLWIGNVCKNNCTDYNYEAFLPWSFHNLATIYWIAKAKMLESLVCTYSIISWLCSINYELIISVIELIISILIDFIALPFYTDAIKSNVQKRLRYEEERLQKGLLIHIKVYACIYVFANQFTK